MVSHGILEKSSPRDKCWARRGVVGPYAVPKRKPWRTFRFHCPTGEAGRRHTCRAWVHQPAAASH